MRGKCSKYTVFFRKCISSVHKSLIFWSEFPETYFKPNNSLVMKKNTSQYLAKGRTHSYPTDFTSVFIIKQNNWFLWGHGKHLRDLFLVQSRNCLVFLKHQLHFIFIVFIYNKFSDKYLKVFLGRLTLWRQIFAWINFWIFCGFAEKNENLSLSNLLYYTNIKHYISQDKFGSINVTLFRASEYNLLIFLMLSFIYMEKWN